MGTIVGAQRPVAIGHRGFSDRAPENTMPAFEAAAGVCGGVELDVGLTRDGEALVCHDWALDRTTDGTGDYGALRWAQVSRLDAGSWFAPEFRGTRLPRLADVVAFANATGTGLNVELKPARGGRVEAERLVATVAELLGGLEAGVGLIVSSFNPLLVREVSALGRFATACLFERGQLGDDWRTVAELAGASYIHPCVDGLSRGEVEAMRACGFGVNVWTVNDYARAAELVEWGVTGLIGNDPQMLSRAVADAAV